MIVKCVVIYIQFTISQIVFPTAATIEQENLQLYIERINNALGEETTNVRELRRTLHSTMNEGYAATAERPMLRHTNTKQKNNNCKQGRCRCEDCEGKKKNGRAKTIWVCSASSCTRDDGAQPYQWWICQRPRCWEEHCRAKHPDLST